MEKQIKIALAGNPNCGKTTLFNALTGSNQFVGNWPGVTVEKKEGRLKKHEDVVIMDLPGIYSLSPYTLEEVVARNYLINERPDAILNIIDGTNLERNLYLTTVPFCCIFILQDAPADGLRHSQELFLPDEAELHLVLVGVADRQFRSLQWVAEACRLDAEVNDLPVGQDEDLLPGAGNALHIHHENAVARKNGLIAHRLVCAHDAFAVQQKRLHILADLLLLDADEVLHRLFPKFHTGSLPSFALYNRCFWAKYSISATELQVILAFWAGLCYTDR